MFIKYRNLIAYNNKNNVALLYIYVYTLNCTDIFYIKVKILKLPEPDEPTQP